MASFFFSSTILLSHSNRAFKGLYLWDGAGWYKAILQCQSVLFHRSIFDVFFGVFWKLKKQMDFTIVGGNVQSSAAAKES